MTQTFADSLREKVAKIVHCGEPITVIDETLLRRITVNPEIFGGKPIIRGMRGVHWGVIKGIEDSLAAISVFKDEVIGTYSSATAGNFVLGKLAGNNPGRDHILYFNGNFIQAEMVKAFITSTEYRQRFGP